MIARLLKAALNVLMVAAVAGVAAVLFLLALSEPIGGRP